MKKTFLKGFAAVMAALALAGCMERIRPERPSGGEHGHGHGEGGHGQTEAQVTERTDWKIDYIGRTDYVEEGSVTRVEEFSFKYTGNGYFIVRAFTAADLDDYYGNDLVSMIDGEVDYVVSLADNDGQKFYEYSSVFDSSVRNVYFDLIIHGDYTVYLIEIGKDGKPTYNYAATGISVEEESPSEGFLRWIGTWRVTDGSVWYDIGISSCEANYLYYVDGWETGDSVQEQMTMDRDWIFARYKGHDSNLYFYGQYLMSYEDESLQDADGNNVWVDQMFVGTYLSAESDKNGVVDEEGAYAGSDIAHTVWQEGGKVVIEPERFVFENGLEAVYHSMRYSRYCYDEGNWAHYNYSGVPFFSGRGITMEKIPGTRSAKMHPRTRELVKRTQMRVHTDSRRH